MCGWRVHERLDTYIARMVLDTYIARMVNFFDFSSIFKWGHLVNNPKIALDGVGFFQ